MWRCTIISSGKRSCKMKLKRDTYVKMNSQIADLFTKGLSTREVWRVLPVALYGSKHECRCWGGVLKVQHQFYDPIQLHLSKPVTPTFIYLFIYFSSFTLIKLSRIIIIECLCASKIYQIALNKLHKLLVFLKIFINF